MDLQEIVEWHNDVLSHEDFNFSQKKRAAYFYYCSLREKAKKGDVSLPFLCGAFSWFLSH